ncbi:hypothetical protein PIROE2DRAFT_17057, partial [Piromyces sp. E2]
PLYIDAGVLYSNKKFLQKYNKAVPETWDELRDTAAYIIEKEKSQGNNDVVGYLGYFPDHEGITASIVEFINSFRDTVESDIPAFNSKNAINALGNGGMFELYDDERCYKPYCDIFKDLQFIRNEASFITKQNDLHNKVKYYSTEFIYGNITAEETLRNIDYIISTYQIDYGSIIGKSIKDKILDIHYSSHDTNGENVNENSSSTKEPLEIVLYTELILSSQQTDISSECSKIKSEIK